MRLTPGPPPEVSIVIPCLNEAETLEKCITKARGALDQDRLAGEIVVADNGSEDASWQIAESMGARVVRVEPPGYGNALMGGIAVAKGQFIIMGDADDSYDFSSIFPFVEKLREGNDLVMGNRFRGGIRPGAMPASHRFLGNPFFSVTARLLFGVPVGDINCGLRAFRKSSYEALGLEVSGMEFAVEMVIKSQMAGMRIAEVPIVLYPDGRSRAPHLQTWQDGWKTLQLMVMMAFDGKAQGTTRSISLSRLLSSLGPGTAASVSTHLPRHRNG